MIIASLLYLELGKTGEPYHFAMLFILAIMFIIWTTMSYHLQTC